MEKKSKLVLAVLQGSDSDNTIRNLNERGFMVTVLSSTGGFLKKNEHHGDDRRGGGSAGRGPGRPAEVCGTPEGDRVPERDMPHGEMSAVPPVPMEVMAGGAAVFIVSLDDIRKVLNPCVSNGKK